VQTILKGFNKPMKKKAEGSTCRFPINWSKENKSGCIKTAQQKVICLIQVQLGSIDTSTFAFSMLHAFPMPLLYRLIRYRPDVSHRWTTSIQ
jgi:hypothetical protein